MVGKPADDLRRPQVTEQVDAEDRHGHRAGTEVHRHGLENERVHRAGAEEDEEHRGGEARHGDGLVASQERRDGRRRSAYNGKPKHPGVAGGVALVPGSGGESAGHRAEQPSHHEHRAKEGRSNFLWHIVNALQERRSPYGKRAEREGVGGVAQDDQAVVRDAEEFDDVAGLWLFCGSADCTSPSGATGPARRARRATRCWRAEPRR